MLGFRCLQASVFGLSLMSCANAQEAGSAAVRRLGSDGPRLSLEVEREHDDLVDVAITYDRANLDQSPRMADFHLSLAGGLSFVQATAGESAVAADKHLVTQVSGSNQVRLSLFASDNLNRLDSGALVHLVLRRTGPGTIELLRDEPLFAPAEAEQFLDVEPSLSL